jgi:hypothetical protein
MIIVILGVVALIGVGTGIWQLIVYLKKRKNTAPTSLEDIIRLSVAKALSSEEQSKYIRQASVEIVALEAKKQQLNSDISFLATDCARLKKTVEDTMESVLSRRSKREKIQYFLMGGFSSVIAFFLIQLFINIYKVIIISGARK